MLRRNMSMLSIPSRIPLSKEGWYALRTPNDGETLGSILTRRYNEFYDTPRRFHQNAVAKAMGVDQSTLSRIMSDELDAGRRKPEQIEAMLKGFQFSEKEIVSLARRFSLRLPEKYNTLYLNNLGSATPNSAIVTIQSLRTSLEGGGLPLPRFILDGHDPERCRYLEIADDVMMCERARPELGKGRILAVADDAEPLDGDFAVYRYKGLDKFVVVLHDEKARTIPVSSLDRHDGDVLQVKDKRLELVGAVVGEYRQGRRSDKLVMVN
jgi:transcriptional regulator with XRE-family HTH domain